MVEKAEKLSHLNFLNWNQNTRKFKKYISKKKRNLTSRVAIIIMKLDKTTKKKKKNKHTHTMSHGFFLREQLEHTDGSSVTCHRFTTTAPPAHTLHRTTKQGRGRANPSPGVIKVKSSLGVETCLQGGLSSVGVQHCLSSGACIRRG